MLRPKPPPSAAPAGVAVQITSAADPRQIFPRACTSARMARSPPPPGGGGGQNTSRGGPQANLSARLHIGKEGTITALTGKVKCGQGARAELTQAAAEKLRAPASSILLIMADTGLCPNDGTTAG